MAAGYGPLVDWAHHVAWDSVKDLEDTVERIGPDRVAAIICEPVIGVGGVLAPPDGYLQGVEALCRRTGALLIADEVVCGFGRVGAWFGSQRFGITPDLIVCAKGITSGYLPLGAVIAGARVREPFYNGIVGPFRHGYTYSGHATVCAVAMANLDIIEDERLLPNANWLEGELTKRLKPLEEHPMVGTVRSGVGVLAAVALEPNALSQDPQLPAKTAAALRDAGVLTRAIVGGELQISPPLVIGSPELIEMVNAFAHALDAVMQMV
jgi:adenosylmethionine-8-amino-7-oxononanoate aminotransferase